MAKFPSGKIYVTRGVNDEMAESAEFALFVRQSLDKHLRGDWGDVSKDDKAENEFSLNKHLRLFSVYKNGSTTIWVISEADRSATTVLFPSEY